MQTVSFRNWREFQENKLASKQANNMYSTLMTMWDNNATCEEFQQYYKELQKSHLYIKHGSLYCQVLSDFCYNRKPRRS